MIRVFTIFTALAVLLTACAPSSTPNRLGSDGKPLPQVYRIKNSDADEVQFRMLDAINSLRSAAGQPPVQFDARLNAAAATHSRDMANQNRPWHFGSDGSSPIQRIQRAGFSGSLIGENISETYESELETLGAWMEKPDTRRIILSKEANLMGFAWFQERSGKLWWTLIMGSSSPTARGGNV